MSGEECVRRNGRDSLYPEECFSLVIVTLLNKSLSKVQKHQRANNDQPSPFGMAVPCMAKFRNGFPVQILTSHNVEWQADL